MRQFFSSRVNEQFIELNSYEFQAHTKHAVYEVHECSQVQSMQY